MTFQVGQLIGGRFRVLNSLSNDGDVWRAIDRVPDRQVAIRRMRVGVHARSLISQLWRVSTVCDRNVARVHAVGLLDDGDVWVASELLQGETLEELLQRRSQLLPGAALDLISDLAHALAEAHDRGVVHGAISPACVTLHRSPSATIVAKLSGFGSKNEAENPCASPETLNSGRECPESDVWSLGVLLFRCVTGKMPFSSTDPMTRLAEVYSVERILMRAELDEPLRQLLRDVLKPARSSRPTAAELATRAKRLARKAQGGFLDLAKMVRITDDVWLNPALTGVVDHFDTIPGCGSDVESEPTSAATPIPVVEERPTLETPQYITPTLDENYCEFEERHPRYLPLLAALVTALTILAVAAHNVMHSPSQHRATTASAHAPRSPN